MGNSVLPGGIDTGYSTIKDSVGLAFGVVPRSSISGMYAAVGYALGVE
jgi:hypothetical protein